MRYCLFESHAPKEETIKEESEIKEPDYDDNNGDYDDNGDDDAHADTDQMSKQKKDRIKIVSVGPEWCGYTQKQNELFTTYCKGNNNIVFDTITELDEPTHIRAFPTTFCCREDEDSGLCVQRHIKNGNKGFVGLRDPNDIETICRRAS